MWVKKSHSSIFFGPFWVLYPVWPTPIYSHLLKWLSPISVDIRSASATNRECCGWVVPSDWNLWRVGSFGRLDLRQFSWDFLGPNLSIWNGHINQNPFSIGYRLFPLTIRNPSDGALCIRCQAVLFVNEGPGSLELHSWGVPACDLPCHLMITIFNQNQGLEPAFVKSGSWQVVDT